MQSPQHESTEIIDASVRANAASLRAQFRSAVPFKHFAVDGFFEGGFARQLLDEFPAAGTDIAPNFYGASGKKAWHSNLAGLGGAYGAADAYFRSAEFAAWISQATGIDGLIYDETNYGGGTHENFEGRDLLPHVDFNYHPVKKLHRRLNLIIYLNEGWQREWGGALKLHRDPRDPLDEPVEYEPLFNRCVAFETSEHSWHGFDLISLPPDEWKRTRKSLSIYLYTRERPAEEVYSEHTTIFVPRPLPARFVAGHVLSEADAIELGGLVGHRDRLIALYQNELSRREPEAEQAARLRMAIAELESHRTVPLMGYVTCVGPVEGLFSDGWSSRRLDFAVRAHRDVASFCARIRLPQGLPQVPALRIEVDGVPCEQTIAHDDVVGVSAKARIAADTLARITISTDSTVNHKACGISEDQRDLGFFVEHIVFEHASAASPAHPETYTFIGDCQAPIFDGLYFAAGDLAAQAVLTRSLWRPFFRPQDLFAGGRLTAETTRMLLESRCIRPARSQPFDVFHPLPLAVDHGMVEEVGFEPRYPERVLVINCGLVEAWYSAGEDAIERDIEQRCLPLFNGLRALRDAGFSRLFLAAIPPPGVPEAGTAPGTLQLRSVMAKRFNRVFEEYCAGNRIGFLATWEDLVLDGVRNPQYDRDGTHLNRDGAIAVIRRLQSLL